MEIIHEQLKTIFSPSRQFAFLVGAGISMDPPASLPSARQITHDLLSYFISPIILPEIEKSSKLRYEMIVENIQTFFDHDLKFLEYLDLPRNPNWLHYLSAEGIGAQMPVITTNFDCLIESAFITLFPQNSFKPVITKNDYLKKPQENTASYNLYKLHGSRVNSITQEDTRESLVSTLRALGKDRQSEEPIGLESYKIPVIAKLLENRNLVILGYSGSDDFDINPFLTRITNIQRIIWIDHSPTAEIKVQIFNAGSKFDPNADYSVIKNCTLLLQLIKWRDIEVIYIQANTSSLAKDVIFPSLFLQDFERTGKKVQENMTYNIQIPPRLSEWIPSRISKPLEIYSTQFTIKLLEDISNISLAVKLSLEGLDWLEKQKSVGNLSIEQNQINSLESWFCNRIGCALREQKKFLDARRYLRLAINYATDAKDVVAKAESLQNYGMTLYYQGTSDTIIGAIKSYESALDVLKNTEHFDQIGRIYNNLGNIFLQLQNYIKTEEYFQKAIEISNQSGDLDAKLSRLNNLGSLYLSQQNFDKAIKYFQDAYTIAKNLQDYHALGIIGSNLGDIYRAMHLPNQAIGQYQDATALAREIGDLIGQSIRMSKVASIFGQSGRAKEALPLLQEAMNLVRRGGSPEIQAHITNITGNNYLALGDYNQAVYHYELAGKTIIQTTSPTLAITIFSNIGYAYSLMQKMLFAIRGYEQALSFAIQFNQVPDIAKVAEKLASIHLSQKNLEQARKMYEQALKAYEQLNLEPQVKSIKEKIAQLL